MRFLFLLFIILFFSKHDALAQNSACTCVSGEKQLKKAETFIEHKEYAEALPFLENISVKSSFCKMEVLILRIQLYVLTNKLSEAESSIKELENLSPESSCDLIKLKYHFHAGNYFIKAEKPDSAMRHFIITKEISETINDTIFLIKTISRIAFVFNKMQQSGKAVEYDHLQLSLARQKKDDKLLLQVYSQMQSHFGVWYDITGDYQYIDSVKRIAAISLSLCKKTNLKLETAQTYSILAGVAYLDKKYQESLILCDSGLLFLDRNKDFRHLHSIFTKKVDAYIELKDYKKSLQFADSSMLYAKLENNPLSIASIYERMYEIAKLQGNYSSALMYHEKFINIRDSVRTIEKTEKINELEQKYNKAENEKKIKELSQKKQIATLRNKIYLTTIIAALLAISLIIIYNRQKTLKSKQENMEIEQRLNRARMNPHFFFNTLNSLQTFSIQENKDSKVARYLSKYAKIMRETLESTYKEMNTIEQEVDFLTNYLDVQKLRYPDKFEYNINIDEQVEPTETYIPSMIIQPFIENSIEHGLNTSTETGIIDLNIAIEKNHLIVKIDDNGSGFTNDKKSKEYPSRATQIIKDRLLLLNKKLKTDATYEINKGNNNTGTSVKIILPLIHTHEGFNN